MKVYFSLLLVAFSFWLKAQENYQYKDKVILTNNDTITGEVIDLDIRRMAIVLHKSGRVEKIKDWRINKVIYNNGTTVIIKEEINKLYGGKLDNLLSVESAAFIRNVVKVRYEHIWNKKFSSAIALSTSFAPVNIYKTYRYNYEFINENLHYNWQKNIISFDTDFFRFYYYRQKHLSFSISFFTSFDYDRYEVRNYSNPSYINDWSYITGINNSFSYYSNAGVFARFSVKFGHFDFLRESISYYWANIIPVIELNVGYNLQKILKSKQ